MIKGDKELRSSVKTVKEEVKQSEEEKELITYSINPD